MTIHNDVFSPAYGLRVVFFVLARRFSLENQNWHVTNKISYLILFVTCQFWFLRIKTTHREQKRKRKKSLCITQTVYRWTTQRRPDEKRRTQIIETNKSQEFDEKKLESLWYQKPRYCIELERSINSSQPMLDADIALLSWKYLAHFHDNNMTNVFYHDIKMTAAFSKKYSTFLSWQCRCCHDEIIIEHDVT